MAGFPLAPLRNAPGIVDTQKKSECSFFGEIETLNQAERGFECSVRTSLSLNCRLHFLQIPGSSFFNTNHGKSLLFLSPKATGRGCSGELLELLNPIGGLIELPCNTLEEVRERLTTSAQVSKLCGVKFVVGVRGVGARPRNFHSSSQTSFFEFRQECI